ncbi:MAG: helix-turn-helix domain-containing protein [Caldilineae bacterium]|nr:MAG: helix-turn-helix domain-containing protein [Caldilineae bacterium]
MEDERKWLTLSAASKLLGVHPATLRQWADSGQVPSYRTPGGHRRFDAAELREFLMAASTAHAPEAAAVSESAIVETVLSQTRSELQEAPPAEDAWYSAFDEQGRERQRALGREVFEDAIQYLTHPDDRADLARNARRLGRAYAENALRYHISLLETVRAFQYFRLSLLKAITDSDIKEQLKTARHLRATVDTYLNEVLYGLIDAFENDLLGTRLLLEDLD